MSYADAIERTWRENLLFSALVELTYRCNLDCFFCYNDTKLAGATLSTQQYLRFFGDLRELGTLNLTLTGGEPLAHPAFFTLGAAAREMGFVVRVKTNGHALRGRIAQRMKDEVDPFNVEVSLHGASAATHERQTRVAGSFERLVANIREARGLGLRMRINSPLTAWNEHEIDAMFALADQLGVPIQCDPEVTRRDDGDASPLAIAPAPSAIARLHAVERARRGASAHGHPDAAPAQSAPPDTRPVTGPAPASAAPAAARKHCGAGSSSITVDPYGNVYPCVQWRRRIGNLHEQSIATLWNSSADLAEVRRLSGEVAQMVEREGAAGIAFCPGSAERETGSATGVYPAAQVLLDLRRRTATGR